MGNPRPRLPVGGDYFPIYIPVGEETSPSPSPNRRIPHEESGIGSPLPCLGSSIHVLALLLCHEARWLAACRSPLRSLLSLPQGPAAIVCSVVCSIPLPSTPSVPYPSTTCIASSPCQVALQSVPFVPPLFVCEVTLPLHRCLLAASGQHPVTDSSHHLCLCVAKLLNPPFWYLTL